MNIFKFKKLMQTVADGWNKGNAKKAASCFTINAIYSEPPDKQLYKGRNNLYEYFGGKSAKSGDMKMVWHNLVFDEQKQIGAGEYTFEMHSKNHGVAIVKIENDKISNWREYQWAGNLDFDSFLGKNKF